MNWKTLANGAITAAASGGAMTVGALALDPMNMDWKKLGMVFLAGAALGVINWIRKNPWHPSEAGEK